MGRERHCRLTGGVECTPTGVPLVLRVVVVCLGPLGLVVVHVRVVAMPMVAAVREVGVRVGVRMEVAMMEARAAMGVEMAAAMDGGGDGGGKGCVDECAAR